MRHKLLIFANCAMFRITQESFVFSRVGRLDEVNFAEPVWHGWLGLLGKESSEKCDANLTHLIHALAEPPIKSLPLVTNSAT